MKKVINPETIRNIRDSALQTYRKKLSEEWRTYRQYMYIIYTITPQLKPSHAALAKDQIQRLKKNIEYQRTLIKYLCDQIRALNTPENYSMKTSENTYVMVCYDDLAAMGNVLDELCDDLDTILTTDDDRDGLVQAANNIAESLSIINSSEQVSWGMSAQKYMTWLTSEEENSED